MGRRILAIVMATLLAVIGAVLVFLYARSADSRALAGQEARNVYVTTAVVPVGTTLKEAINLGLIQKTTVAAKAEPVGALETVDGTNQNLLALSDVPPGQYVLAAAFGKTPLGTKAIQVPDGMLAVAVSLTDPQRVGNFVTPGSHITVFQSYKLKKLGTDDASKQFNELDIHGTSVLLPDAVVIGMGNTSLTPAVAPTASPTQQPQSPGANFLVTLAVTPADAVRLVHAINNYSLYAGLRGSDVNVEPRLATDDRAFSPK